MIPGDTEARNTRIPQARFPLLAKAYARIAEKAGKHIAP